MKVTEKDREAAREWLRQWLDGDASDSDAGTIALSEVVAAAYRRGLEDAERAILDEEDCSGQATRFAGYIRKLGEDA